LQFIEVIHILGEKGKSEVKLGRSFKKNILPDAVTNLGFFSGPVKSKWGGFSEYF
jgi:hypothetical protein